MSDPTKSIPPSRARAIGWAREIVANPDTIFLDTETCGKETDSEVVDIGIVSIDGTVLMDQLVRPSSPIPEDASRIHGITNEMVADAPVWAEIHDRVAAAVDGRLTIIYNAQYDTAILRNESKRFGSQFELHFECSMLAFSDFKATPGKYGQFRWHRLEVAAAEFGIPPGGHRALSDAETTRSLVLAMANWEEDPPEPPEMFIDDHGGGHDLPEQSSLFGAKSSADHLQSLHDLGATVSHNGTEIQSADELREVVAEVTLTSKNKSVTLTRTREEIAEDIVHAAKTGGRQRANGSASHVDFDRSEALAKAGATA